MYLFVACEGRSPNKNLVWDHFVAPQVKVRQTMNIIKFGSESEYVKLEIPTSFSTGGWAQIPVEICVNCFSGTINPWIDSADIELFATGLRKLYETLKGQAEFVPLEKQLTLKFESKTGGKISVTGIAWSQATYENKLEFHLELDQTYLQLPLKALEILCGEIKANA